MKWFKEVSRRLIFRLLFQSVFLFGICGLAFAQNPWVQNFTPVRQLYVSPNGTGNGTINSPMNLNAAKNSSLPGDLYWLKAGSYNGSYTISRPGTAAKPIVFRAMPGQQVILDGAIKVTGAHNWIWGLEIKDPDGSAGMPGLQLLATGVHMINNTVHDIKSNLGIGAWDQGSGQVVYGNIVYKQIANGMDPHNIYAQNTYSSHGYKYIVGNMFLDSWDANGDSYNFHAYSEDSAEITGFHIEKNVFKRGRFLLGGYGEPVQAEVIRKNYFYDAPVFIGWRRPTQIKFENNYLGKTGLETLYYWGAGEQIYPEPAPNIYTGNEIYNSVEENIRFRTSAYINGNRCDGCPRIRGTDVFNNNKYSSNFKATFYAAGQNSGTINFTTWKSKASNAGNAFDTGSTLVSSVPNTVSVIANEYEPGRGHIVIYNWTNAGTTSVNLTGVVANGAPYVIKNPRNNTIVSQGTYNGPVNISTSNTQFLALLVTSGPGGGDDGGGGGGGGDDRTSPKLLDIGPRDITTSSVRIIWQTDEPADSQIEYGTAPCPCSTNTPLDPNRVLSHSVTISGLTSNKTYYYRVKSRDAAGNLGVAGTRFFKTLATSAPALRSSEEKGPDEGVLPGQKKQSTLHYVRVKQVKSDTAQIKWNTALPANSQVFYGRTAMEGSTPVDPEKVKKHKVTLEGLTPGTTYHFVVKSIDSSGAVMLSIDKSFTTLDE